MIASPDGWLYDLLTADEAAEHAGVQRVTIRQWVYRKHLKQAGTDPETGRPLYRRLDVAKVEYGRRCTGKGARSVRAQVAA